MLLGILSNKYFARILYIDWSLHSWACTCYRIIISKAALWAFHPDIRVSSVSCLCHRCCMMENAQYVWKKLAFFSFSRETEQIKYILWTSHCQNMMRANMKESVMKWQWRKWQWLMRRTRWVVLFNLFILWKITRAFKKSTLNEDLS